MTAIQSFMQPREVTKSASFAGSVRDGIGAALVQYPCSRLQAAFQPETGGLEVRGHVPAPAMREQVVATLQQFVGGAIPIGGSILVLPQPQCGVLNAVEGFGFPQSKDQENDPLEVGEEAQAQVLSFEEGPCASDLQLAVDRTLFQRDVPVTVNIALNAAAGLQLGGAESYPLVFQPFGGFADDVAIEDGHARLHHTPGPETLDQGARDHGKHRDGEQGEVTSGRDPQHEPAEARILHRVLRLHPTSRTYQTCGSA